VFYFEFLRYIFKRNGRLQLPCFWNSGDSGSTLYHVLKFPMAIMDACTGGNYS